MKGTRSTRTALTGILLAFGSSLLATSPLADTPDQDLLPLLYDTLGGDNWHRNDGWLDPDVDWCDWYGVICGEESSPGQFELYALELRDNNLAGEMTPELAEVLASGVAPEMRLDLRDNSIAGTLYQLPLSTRRVRLGNNRFSGSLPNLDTGTTTGELEYLRLNNNQFEGEIPASWEQLSLLELDLSNNRLDGPVDAAFQAIDADKGKLVDLADNAFAGDLPAWLTELPLESDWAGIGSIDICWTDLSINDPEVYEWVADRHVGGPDFEDCLTRSRRSLGPEVSGSWFEPARSGEGYSVMLLENGTPLVYWFTHLSDSRQMWLVATGRHEDTTLFFDDLLRTEGRFGEGYGESSHPIERKGEQRLDGIADDRLHLSSHINYYVGDLAQPGDGPIIHLPNPIDFRTDLIRLSELAGTTCDNQSEFQQYSGAWYNPDRAGEGFIIEILPDDRAVVYWFTYQPDDSGRQAWMIGQGNIDTNDSLCLVPGCKAGDGVRFDRIFQPLDTGHSFPGDLSGVENLDWGEVHISFDDADTGQVYFESEHTEFGTDHFPIERLARPMLAECGEQ
jgi:hypothetical protein